jgi:hypothetical protein
LAALDLSILDCPPGGVESVPQSLIKAREQVPVAVEGELDGGVPEPLLDLLRVGALGDEEGCASVAEVVIKPISA